MKYLKIYEDYKEGNLAKCFILDEDYLTKNGVLEVCKKLNYKIDNVSINSDGTIDTGDFFMREKMLDRLPFEFNKVGDFCVDGNRLKDFSGFPKKAKRILCGKNNFTNLIGCTPEINGDFNVSNCKLTSLEGSPIKVDGYYSFAHNNIKDFNGFPKDFKDPVFYNNNLVCEVIDIFLKTFNGYIHRTGGGRIGQLIDLINDHDVIDGYNINWLAVEMIYYEYLPGIAITPLDLNPYLKIWVRDEIPDPNKLNLKNYTINKY